MKSDSAKHVVIIGAGFAGLWAVKTLFGKKGIRVTLIDRNNYHTFFPLLYQVGAAEVEPEQIAYPIRTLLRGRRNASYLRGDVSRIDYANRKLSCNDRRIGFDYCIIATGSGTDYFSVAGAERFAFPLKTLDDAMILRNHILTCFERAASMDDPDARRKLLTFVIVGGGPTGVEFAGALSELIRGPLKKDFISLPMNDVSVVLVESADRVLPMFSPKLSAYTTRRLRKMGVDVRLSAPVKEISARGVTFMDGSICASDTVIWTAGVSGTAPGSDDRVPLSRGNRIRTLPTLQIPDYRQVYVAGDLVYLEEGGAPLPMIAPVAIQQGRWAALNVLRQERGGEPRPFAYRDRGAMVTIGRNAAVARIGAREFRGFIAWIIWIVIHIMNLIGFRNKLFVIVNWIWDYLFFERSVRLILPGCCVSPEGNACLHRPVSST
ncbi:MAG: pyridine nucleotide-disulfide oxidoreductase [Spirochaetes bacterium RBG_13_51_14]|nr:MAG: pyridine nucleotide-disulfide oxidoreductase [Spirochaetes bacterium RBG_13_51_14]